MKTAFKKSVVSVALATSLIGAGMWSTAAHACAVEPYIASVCVMAMPNYTTGFGNGTFLLAAGQTLALSQNQALFALISTTYGGDGRTNFMLPDMRGRVLVGAGQGAGLPLYKAGDKGGAVAVQLTAANLPAHAHALGTAATATVTGAFAATTSLANTAANLAGIPVSASASSLTLNASSGGTATANPAGAALGTDAGRTPTLIIYSNATPTVAMKAGSITGNVSGTLSGTAPITGTATTTITGAPTVTLGGSTAVTGAIAPAGVSVMPPYLSMYYYIAVQGSWPSQN